MSDASLLRAVAFATADGSLWAAAVDHGTTALVLGAGSAGAGLADGVTVTADGELWRIEGDGIALEVRSAVEPTPPVATDEPTPPVATDETDAPAAVALPPPGPEAPELCRVTGTVRAGDTHAVDCAGIRVVVPAASSAKAAPASARLVSGWLDDESAFALVAVRPRNAKHQDDDRVVAAMFDPEAWLAVSDPRLSTTYDGSGVPTRTNLELWVGEGDNEYPRRAAGELAGPVGSVAADGLALEVVPLSCHSRGREGAGVYALATF